MILQTAIELFVERLEAPRGATGLRAARRLILVDACRPGLRSDLLVAELRAGFGVACDLLDGLDALAAADSVAGAVVWILLDDQDQVAYCELLREDLAAGAADAAALIAVGDLDGDAFAGRITRAQAGGGSALRRRRELAAGAATLSALFTAAGGGG